VRFLRSLGAFFFFALSCCKVLISRRTPAHPNYNVQLLSNLYCGKRSGSYFFCQCLQMIVCPTASYNKQADMFPATNRCLSFTYHISLFYYIYYYYILLLLLLLLIIIIIIIILLLLLLYYYYYYIIIIIIIYYYYYYYYYYHYHYHIISLSL